MIMLKYVPINCSKEICRFWHIST